MKGEPDPTFFETPAEFRAWLESHHDRSEVLWVGFHKKATGRPSIDWPELVDELLCFGWIDGLRKSIDEERWMIRITPRRPNSDWSETNRRRFGELSAEGRVQPAGRAAFRRWETAASERDAGDEPSGAGVYEDLDPAFEQRFRAEPAAWAFFQSESHAYRRTVTRWVMSAKREETRLRRLERLMEDSAAGRRIREMRR
ncbi:MAG: YdeI/OmpD-associated family protein [Gemmatimonadota bacterium]